MNTHDIELPPLPDADWYAVWHGQTLYGIYATLTEATDAASKLNVKGSVSAIFTEQHLQEAQRAAIEADRQARGNADASTNGGEPNAVADALENADWSGVNIGNKALIKAAIEELRQRRGEPVAWLIDHIAADPQVVFKEPKMPECPLASAEVEITPLYKSPQPQQIPEGYKLVPIRPTEEMLKASLSACDGKVYCADAYLAPMAMNEDRYRAMLEAAPEPKGRT